ncbi:MAG: histidine phosphatase family protein [Roseovarius sp.]
MAELILVRHGQANSHATDEDSYDRLSDLGADQARWLGEHIAATNPRFDRVLTGTLRRQVETAHHMGIAVTAQDPRLNELSYFALAQAALDAHAIPVPTDATGFATHLPQVIGLWTAGHLPGVPESFDAFAARITDVLTEQCADAGRTLLVTSGGVIGMALRHVLSLDDTAMARVMLQINNASMHRLSYVHDTLMVAGFNAIPHLDRPDRAHARTYV